MSARDDKASLSIQIHSTMLCSSQPFSLLSFLPSIPPFPCLTLLYLTQLSNPLSPFLPPPPPPVKLLFFCAALTHSSSTLKRGRRGKQKGRGWKGGERKGGKLETRVQVIFYLIVVEKWVSKERESWEIKGKQKVTEMERLRNSERMKATNVKRDSSVFGGVKSISFLLRCQLYFSHPHFLIFQLLSGRILFTSFVLSSSSFRFRSYQEPCW